MTTLLDTLNKKNSIVISKDEARRIGRTARMMLSEEEYRNKSQAIAEEMKKAPELLFEPIHIYRAIGKNHEVATELIIAHLKKKALSAHVFIQSIDAVFPETTFQTVILPCVAVDKSGNRVGYGGGHYDRFLDRQSRAQKIALCFSSQIIDGQIESEAHDQSVDMIVSEHGIIRCR